MDQVISKHRLIYWLLPHVMGHLQGTTLPEWYFVAPEAAVNQSSDLYIVPHTQYVVWNYWVEVKLICD